MVYSSIKLLAGPNHALAIRHKAKRIIVVQNAMPGLGKLKYDKELMDTISNLVENIRCTQ